MKRLAAILLLLLIHFALVRALSGADFMGALAAARHGHPALAAAFALLLLLRLLTLVLLPGIRLCQHNQDIRFVFAPE